MSISISGNGSITGVLTSYTFDKSVSVGGTLTYEDVTNVDSVGIITAQSGIELTGGSIQLGTGTTISAPTSNEFNVSTNGSEALRIDSSGKIGIGVNSPEELVHINAVSAGSLIDLLKIDNGSGATGTEAGIVFECGVDRTARISSENIGSDLGILKFWTAGSIDSLTERMRLTQEGRLSVYTTSTDGHGFRSSQTSSTSHILIGGLRNASSNNDGTFVFVVRTNGQVENSTGIYGTLSDIKLKENIIDASSQWQDIKSLRIVNYNFKEETGYDTHTQLGVIAQEVELVSPGLVSESNDKDEENNDIGTVTKSVKSSVLYMKAVKALQEAMERIETLEAEVAALKAA